MVSKRQTTQYNLHRGGFEPDRSANPEATEDFNAWRIATIGY